jgi:hypothetical protein
MKFVKDQDMKISKASKSTPKKAQTPYKPRVTRSTAKEGSSEVITDATPVIVVPGRIPI